MSLDDCAFARSSSTASDAAGRVVFFSFFFLFFFPPPFPPPCAWWRDDPAKLARVVACCGTELSMSMTKLRAGARQQPGPRDQPAR
jgi:hypothetical protein